VAADRMPPDG